MRVQCPSCDTRLRVTLPDDDTRVECPKCGTLFRPRDPDDEEDAPAPKKRGKKKAKEKKAFPVAQVVGTAVAAVVAIGAVVWVVSSRPKPEPAKPAPEVAAEAKKPDAPRPIPAAGPRPEAPTNRPPVTGTPEPDPAVEESAAGPRTRTVGAPAAKRGGPAGGETAREEPNPLRDLFRVPADLKPPTLRAATLKRDADALPLDVPTFFSLRSARQPANAAVPKAAKLSLDDLKKATVFIRVDAGELSGTGSGFLIGLHPADRSGVVATNYHVIEAAEGPKEGTGPERKITVVFNSGEPAGEQELPAQILAVDPIADLAILGVKGSIRFPKPIDPWATPKLTETMDVRILGFPFGSQLATAGKNPNISVNNGSVSSLRLNKGGKLEQVQISGPLNPGNSGGPIVDKDGRLVGIAVATITGSGLGFAVPVNDLIALLEGRLLVTAFIPTGLEGGAARFQVLVPIMDPLSQIRTVYVRYWTGPGDPPKAVKDKTIGWKPIERAQQLELDMLDTGTSLSIATGELKLPQGATQVVLQIASENTSRPPLVAASPPVTYKLSVADIATGSDARPFSELTQDPGRLAGRVVVVRGRVLGPPAGRGEAQELLVAAPDGTRPPKMRFLASRELAPHFDDVEREHQPRPARLTCVVGARGADGVVPVRVARVDFLGRGDHVVRSIPDETTDQLSALNRNPAKFAGQTLTLPASAVPMTARTSGSSDLLVIFPNHRRPRNLAFVTAPGMNERIAEEKLKTNGIYKTRLTAAVGDPPARPGDPVKVTVSKIELLDPKDGQVLKTIE